MGKGKGHSSSSHHHHHQTTSNQTSGQTSTPVVPTTSTNTTNTHAPRRCTPVVYNAYGETPNSADCGQGPFTLVNANANPMHNVFAEVFNYGTCAALYTFNRVNNAPYTVTVQPGEDFTVAVPGRVTSITATCLGAPTEGSFCYAGTYVQFTLCV